MKQLKQVTLSLIQIYTMYIALYVIFWLLYDLVTGNGVGPESVSINFQSTISLVLACLTALVCGFFFIKKINKEGILIIVCVITLMVLVDLVSSFFSIKGAAKAAWFPYTFYPLFVFFLFVGVLVRIKRHSQKSQSVP